MKKTIRTLVICMAAVMLLAMFASCGAEKVSENAVTVNVKITAGDTGDGNALTPNYLRLSQAERERLERQNTK